MKKKSFNLIEQYKLSLEYLKNSKKFIYIIIGIFLFFVFFGFFIPAPEIVQEKILQFIQELLRETEGMSQFEIIFYLISNNVKSTFFGVFFGILLGIFPLISAVINGYLLGFVAMISVENAGLSSLWKLFPHGIFELPAVFISLGLGLRLGVSVLRRNENKNLNTYLINSLKVFLLIVIPLLLIAGIIEGTLIFWLN